MSGSSGKAVIQIELSGSRWEDARRALQALREKAKDPHWVKPRGWVYHHTGAAVAKRGTIQVVPFGIHASLPHTGGFATGPAPVEGPDYPLGASPLPLRNAYPALRPDSLMRLEKTLEVVLPQDYRAFLLQSNGGEPRVAGFRGESGQNERLDCFLGLAKGQSDDLVSFLGEYAERLPEEFLPIAYDSFGNLVCLSLDRSCPGVWFWDHELEPEPDDDEASNLTRIAADFTSFLRCFFEAP